MFFGRMLTLGLMPVRPRRLALGRLRTDGAEGTRGGIRCLRRGGAIDGSVAREFFTKKADRFAAFGKFLRARPIPARCLPFRSMGQVYPSASPRAHGLVAPPFHPLFNKSLAALTPASLVSHFPWWRKSETRIRPLLPRRARYVSCESSPVFKAAGLWTCRAGMAAGPTSNCKYRRRTRIRCVGSVRPTIPPAASPR